MDLRFLESFVTVAEMGSVAAAARRLHITPAALAQRLRALERDLGQVLVMRAGRVVVPTPAGQAVLARARGLLDSARDLRAAAAGEEPAGQLRLGAVASLLTGVLPQVLGDLAQDWPQLEYFVRPGSSAALCDAVLAGDLDAGLIVRPPFELPKAAAWQSLRRERLILIAPAALGQQSAADLLQTQRFIRYDRAQWGGQLVERWLRGAGFAPREWLELDALDAITALVSRGLGVAILPDWAAPWPEGLQLARLELPGPAVFRDCGVISHRPGVRGPAVRAFVSACTKITHLPPEA